ncbi:MAG: hypothetical protein D6767_11055, partial [Candidatus Hydrogenedentota bacterium]
LYLKSTTNEFFIFHAEFIRDFFLDSSDTEGNPIYLFNADISPITSNLIEKNFQVPEKWQQVLLKNTDTAFFNALLRRELFHRSYFLMLTQTENLHIILMQVIQEEEATMPIKQLLKKELWIVLALAPILFFFAFVQARKDTREIKHIGSILQDIASRKFEKEISVRYQDERKLIYFHLQRLQKKLKRYHEMQLDKIIQNEQKLKILIHHLPDSLYLMDEEGSILFSNRDEIPLYKMAYEGQYISESEMAKKLFKRSKQGLKQGIEIETLTEAGNYRYLQFFAEEWKSYQGETAGYLLIVRDITNKKTKFDKEIEYAMRVQKEYLPQKIIPFAGIEYSFYYKPMVGVGGDYYDFFLLPNGNPIFVVADVTGHGIQAALSMTVIRVIFREICRRYQDAKAIAEEFNNSLIRQLPGVNLVPLTFFIVDKNKQKAYYQNLGQTNCYLMREGSLITLERTGVIAGLMPDKQFRPREIWLQRDDTFFLATDGVVECRKEQGLILGDDRLEELLQEIHTQDVHRLGELLIEKLTQFVEGENFQDDITFLFIKITENLS